MALKNLPPSKTLPNKQQEDLSEYFSDSNALYLTGGFVTHGPPKHGKSFFAATASSYYPDGLKMEECRSIVSIGEERWRKLKPVKLEDVLWLTYDLGALDGFPQFKIDVPAIDVRALVKRFGAPGAVRKVNEVVRKFIEANPSIEWIIEDTTSKKDRLLLDYFAAHPVMSRDGVTEDKYAKWGSMKEAHISSHNALQATGCKIHYLCHSKAAPDSQQATPHQKKVDATMEMPSNDDGIEPEISGQGYKAYIGDASVIGVLLATEVPNKKGKYDRGFYPFGGKNFVGGTRLQTLLQVKQPPDMQLVLRALRSLGNG